MKFSSETEKPKLFSAVLGQDRWNLVCGFKFWDLALQASPNSLEKIQLMISISAQKLMEPGKNPFTSKYNVWLPRITTR